MEWLGLQRLQVYCPQGWKCRVHWREVYIGIDAHNLWEGVSPVEIFLKTQISVKYKTFI